MAKICAQTTWLKAYEAYTGIEDIVDARLARAVGAVAVLGVMGGEYEQVVDNESTLLCALQLAQQGDKESAQTVETNVSTDIAERLYKVAHRTSVRLQLSAGHIEQNGRKLSSMSQNTLKHAVLNSEMRRRTQLDMRNVFLVEELAERGMLDDHDVVVFSPASNSMSQKEKRDYGFFTDTESCSIQLFSLEGNEVELETAFVAGKRTPTSPRHDITAIKRMASRHNATIDEYDGTEMLRSVMLVPKSNRVDKLTTIIKDYDVAAGGTFYGQEVTGDYEEQLEICARREQNFAKIVEAVKDHLLAESHTFRTPLEAIMRLDELSEQYCVEFAVQNVNVDAAVFGETSAMHIAEARFFIERGELERANMSLDAAVETAQSGSCPLFKGSEKGDSNSGESSNNNDSETGKGKKKWMNCPFCRARVYGDPCAKKLSCWDCNASVVNGKVVSKGNGGSKAKPQPQSSNNDTLKASSRQFAMAA